MQSHHRRVNFFTSDLHLGHSFVAYTRGFGSDVEAHDARVLEGLSALTKRDTLFVLGDVAVGMYDRNFARMADATPARIHLVTGNHDRSFAGHRSATTAAARALKHVESVSLHARVSLDGLPMLMSHMPYEGDRGEDRFTQWRLRDCGVPLLHGHVHLPQRITRTRAGTLQVHVGLDAWDLQPVSERTLRALVDAEIDA